MRKSIRRLLLYPVLIFGGCHLLMTGSPIPLWHLEELNDPVAVRSITNRHLILADGRKVTLPFIAEIPAQVPLFRKAMAYGVEVTGSSEVYGMMWHDRLCGNDPVAWKRLRVNLSDLAGAIHPEGIDPSLVHPETIASLAEDKLIDAESPNRHHTEGKLTGWDRLRMRRIREQVEYSIAQQNRPEHQ